MKEQCRDIEKLLAGYALKSLSPETAQQVEDHLVNCPSCQKILEDYLLLEDELRQAVPAVEPPTRIRSRLEAYTQPVPKTRTKMKPRGWFIPDWTAAAALAAVLMLIAVNIFLIRNNQQILNRQNTLIEQNRAFQTAAALLTYPDTRVEVIDDGTLYGTLVYDPDGSRAVLTVWGLDSLPSDQDYQIWLIEHDQNRISGGVFHNDQSGSYSSVMIESPFPLETFAGLGVTIEPAGGSPGPTGPKVLGIEL